MNVLTSDFETTTFSNGSPFDSRNKAVCLAMKQDARDTVCTFDLTKLNFSVVSKDDLYVFFNAKYDLHWYRKLGVDIGSWKVYCCQVAEFILSGQTQPYPSLEQTAQKYGLGHKIDAIKLDYWDKGINTDAIPQDILGDYCKQDVDLTYQIYLKQKEQFEANPKLYALLKLQMYDLLVLEEMEWNGLLYNEELCVERSKDIEKRLEELYSEFTKFHDGVPLNLNSGDQLSAFLYGGVVQEEVKEHIGFFKTGAKAGQPKYKNVTKEHILPRLVEPLKGTELKKEGYWKTDEATLRKLKGKAATKFVGPLLEIAKLEKLNSTYYKGLPAKNKEGCWKEGYIYGQYNQCVAATGRLSSSKPNLQNFSGECLDIFVSRY